MSVLAGHAQPGGAGIPVIRGLADIWQRLRAIGSPQWQFRFTKSMIRYLDACKLEATLLDLRQWPSSDLYIKHRPYLGAVHLEPDLAEVVEQIDLPEYVREHPDLEMLTLLCCNIVCWSNDLFSLEKELQNGDNHNLALILQHERDQSLQAAIREAAAIHDRDMRRFVELSRQLPPFEKEIAEPVQHYIQSLQSIISANMEWSIHDSKRYRFAFETTVSL